MEEPARGGYIAREHVQMVEPARRDAARYVTLRLVLERRGHVRRGRKPPRLPIELDGVPIRRSAPVSWPVGNIFDPVAAQAIGFESRDQPMQCRLVADAQAHVAKT